MCQYTSSVYGNNVYCSIGHDINHLPYDFSMICRYSDDGSLMQVSIQCFRAWYTKGESDSNGHYPIYWHSDQETLVISGDRLLSFLEYRNDLSLRTTLTWGDCVSVVDMAMAYHEGKISIETLSEYIKALGIRGDHTRITYNDELIYDTMRGDN